MTESLSASAREARLPGKSAPPIFERRYLPVYGVTIASSLVALVAGWASGVRHDYVAYLQQWRLVLSGGDPWSTNNAYGPLHNLLAYLTVFGPLAPKLFMLAAMLAANFLLVATLVKRWSAFSAAIYLLCVPFNFLLLGICVSYGLNDTLVAFFFVAAILSRHERSYVLAGMFIALAGLLKYYPVLLLPLLAIDGRRINPSVLISGMAVFALGLLASVAVWGVSVFDPLMLGAARGAKLLSVLAAASNVWGHSAILSWLLKYNAVFVVAGVALVFFLARRWRWNWLVAVTFGYAAMLLLYKLGHQQFYVPLLFAVAALPLVEDQAAEEMMRCMLPLVLFLSVYQALYQYGSDEFHHRLGAIRSYGGFVAFPLTVGCLGLFLARAGFREGDAEA